MKKGIQDLAYLIKQAKDNNEPKPIVFLGAGASVSGGIPLANGIIERILKDFKDKPAIINLSPDKKNNYYELMTALNAKERRKLFQDYIEEAKVNTAHIYLAQLVKLGYIDYVLTVNFDDLLLRACGLFNYTMPTYDISNLNEFTTTTFQKESITYLHGQHYGEWLLNAKGELEKVKDRIPLLLNKICHDRTFIIVGYSGEDEVFDSIKEFASFDNELFWVNYLNNNAADIVQNELLNISTKNAHSISGYDADTFFLDLHSKLGLPTPEIIDKPFSFLKSMMREIKMPEEIDVIEDHKDLYKGLSERMEISNSWIDEAINDIQEKDSVKKFKQEIIEAYVKEKFEENEGAFLEKIKLSKFKNAKPELSDFYVNWGYKLHESIQRSKDYSMIDLVYEKYKKAIELNHKSELAHYNYGTLLLGIAKLNQDELKFKESFIQFEKALNLNGSNISSFINYGIALSDLAKFKQEESLFEKSFIQYEKAIELNPKNYSVYNNYGIALSELANLKQNETLFEKCLIQYEKAIELNPKQHSTYFNYGNAISDLAELNKDLTLFRKSFDQYEKAIELNPEYELAYDNYTSTLLIMFHIFKFEYLEEMEINLKKAKALAEKTVNLGGSSYNLSCIYSLLKEKNKALKHLKKSLSKGQIDKDHVLKDQDWKHYKEDPDFIELMEKY
ncbi:tetratricopeptide repeat protein [Nonlabens dokdonensis]|nr:tetratricopeptide repeat protein [Nonlabens dokdonensis]